MNNSRKLKKKLQLNENDLHVTSSKNKNKSIQPKSTLVLNNTKVCIPVQKKDSTKGKKTVVSSIEDLIMIMAKVEKGIKKNNQLLKTLIELTPHKKTSGKTSTKTAPKTNTKNIPKTNNLKSSKTSNNSLANTMIPKSSTKRSTQSNINNKIKINPVIASKTNASRTLSKNDTITDSKTIRVTNLKTSSKTSKISAPIISSKTSKISDPIISSKISKINNPIISSKSSKISDPTIISKTNTFKNPKTITNNSTKNNIHENNHNRGNKTTSKNTLISQLKASPNTINTVTKKRNLVASKPTDTMSPTSTMNPTKNNVATDLTSFSFIVFFKRTKDEKILDEKIEKVVTHINSYLKSKTFLCSINKDFENSINTLPIELETSRKEAKTTTYFKFNVVSDCVDDNNIGRIIENIQEKFFKAEEKGWLKAFVYSL